MKENLFLLFLSLNSNLPLILKGKPGTSKNLSAQLISKTMKGKYSRNKFFQLFPEVELTYFQGSELTQPKDVENLFNIAEKKLLFLRDNNKKERLLISMILFDKMELAERSKSNPLKVLYSKLEFDGKKEGISFIGISNYSLDSSIINRALVLSVPDLDQNLEDLIKTSRSIVESICWKLRKNKIFEILARAYFNYKKELQIIKELVVYKKFLLSHNNRINGIESKIYGDNQENFHFIKELKEFKDLFMKENKIKKDFHGTRDLLSLIKGIAKEFGKLGDSDINNNDKILIIVNYIERNFGGIDYEIDIDLNVKMYDIIEDIKVIKKILEECD